MKPSERRLISSARECAGFSLIELLVVLFLVFVLVSWLLPGIGNPPGRRAKATACMNNVKQLSIAWITYPADNQDRLMPNPGWVAGVMDWNPNNPDNTNSAQLIDTSKSLIGDYVHSPDVFKCPAD